MSSILPSWAAGGASSARDTDAIARALQAALSGAVVPVDEPVKLEPATVSEQGGVGRRMKKRKTRAKSETPTTTYITTDPANFRRMVQEATGLRARKAVKPEMQQLAAATTSAAAALLSGRDAGVEGGAKFGGMERFQNCYFPTLESWTVMM